MVLSVTVVRAVTDGWGQGFPSNFQRKQEENRTIRTLIAAVWFLILPDYLIIAYIEQLEISVTALYHFSNSGAVNIIWLHLIWRSDTDLSCFLPIEQ